MPVLQINEYHIFTDKMHVLNDEIATLRPQ
jgi:hypothetical protein